ncbi:MAG: type II toxin-antitoxin system PrlF family antitoxin [Deltaproteobacteria bacterium]|nr:type II toxin-antitoxin system PrlF family antitoxin [Deltaproteobacteria bacterium]
MSVSTLTSKGQTTIPLEVRDFLKIKSGDRLEYIISKGGEILLKPLHTEVSSLKGLLKKFHKGPAVSLEEMNQVIQERKRKGSK